MTAPESTPAWGTAPERPTEVRYTVVGFYEANGQRFCEHRYAATPRAAEDAVMAEFGEQTGDDGEPCVLRVCGVLAVEDGWIKCVDGYATYLDPDEPDRTGG